jgi:hypothetical protein
VPVGNLCRHKGEPLGNLVLADLCLAGNVGNVGSLCATDIRVMQTLAGGMCVVITIIGINALRAKIVKKVPKVPSRSL